MATRSGMPARTMFRMDDAIGLRLLSDDTRVFCGRDFRHLLEWRMMEVRASGPFLAELVGEKPDMTSLWKALDAANTFYTRALHRSFAISTRVKEKGMIALVLGGFHTAAVCDDLVHEGIAVKRFMPTISATPSLPYHEALRGNIEALSPSALFLEMLDLIRQETGVRQLADARIRRYYQARFGLTQTSYVVSLIERGKAEHVH